MIGVQNLGEGSHHFADYADYSGPTGPALGMPPTSPPLSFPPPAVLSPQPSHASTVPVLQYSPLQMGHQSGGPVWLNWWSMGTSSSYGIAGKVCVETMVKGKIAQFIGWLVPETCLCWFLKKSLDLEHIRHHSAWVQTEWLMYSHYIHTVLMILMLYVMVDHSSIFHMNFGMTRWLGQSTLQAKPWSPSGAWINSFQLPC